ncbi:MAG TPA: STAS domain-containing protein [Chitinivibrionales bacterium]|nr:STAS domain-containing protein [Chitinivibrionales bacterium]
MRSEALDITLEGRGRTLWLFLSGPFHQEQVPSMREKIAGLIDDGNRHLVIDLENVIDIDESATQMFLSLLNMMRSKGGDIWFIFKNENVSKAFGPFKTIFPVYPDAQSLPAGGFLSSLRRSSRMLSRKTGIRLSRPIALTLLVTLFGWILTLMVIIYVQSQQIHRQETQIRTLTEWNSAAGAELKELRERIKPLEQLGVLKDSAPKKKP